MKPAWPAAIIGAALTASAMFTTAGSAQAAPVVGNKPSYGPDVSSTGRYIVFASDATNLVAGDVNGKRDIFIRDTQAGTTRLVSRGLNGRPSNGASTSPTVSDDGRYVTFASSASNLVVGDTNTKADAFRADLVTGRIIRVSVSSGGAQANGVSATPKISGNGASIAFVAAASNLVARDTNGVQDVFLRDIAAGTTKRVSLAPTGDQLMQRGAGDVTISNNGSIVGFSGPSGSADAIYRWNRSTGKTQFVSEDYGDDDVYRPVASNGGVSYLLEHYRDVAGGYSVYRLVANASPASESFVVYLDDADSYINGYDVSRWGAMAVADVDLESDGQRELVLFDDYWPDHGPLASLPVSANALSMSADGSTIAYADSATGQIMTWKWASATVVPVSVG